MKKQLWYSASCRYWTDDWSKLKIHHVIPCCPVCGSLGYIIGVKEWWKSAKAYGKDKPGYVKWLKSVKEHCDALSYDEWIKIHDA